MYREGRAGGESGEGGGAMFFCIVKRGGPKQSLIKKGGKYEKISFHNILQTFTSYKHFTIFNIITDFHNEYKL